MPVQINEINAKTILTKSGLPGSDYVINPYWGCQFGCMYCYAAAIAKWQHPTAEWGSYIDVKINASILLKKELENKYQKNKYKNFGSIFFSSVTDPYTSIENKYQNTRQCLQVLANFSYQGPISIQTKSPLILRDIDILKQIKLCNVGFTITSLDDKISRFLEVGAPPISSRLNALKKLHENGIKTYAFVGPILPHFINNPDLINDLLDALLKHGVKEVWFEHLNLSPKIKSRLYNYLQNHDSDLIPVFESADTVKYRNSLDEIILKAIQERGMKMGLGRVIYHKKAKPN